MSDLAQGYVALINVIDPTLQNRNSHGLATESSKGEIHRDVNLLDFPPPPQFFPKQFTVGVLNATLDLAALVLVGVVGFLGSEVVLSAVVSRCLPSCGGWVLVGVVGFLGSEVVLSPVVSHCLRLSPFMWGVGVGWCGRLLGL